MSTTGQLPCGRLRHVRSSDPDGDQLSYQWEFGDGASERRALVHHYPGPGPMMRCFGSRRLALIGDGAVLPFQVFVKRPPVAVAGLRPGGRSRRDREFDGSGSPAGDRPIRLQSGTSTTAAAARATSLMPSRRSGRYVVTLRVQDDCSPPCDFRPTSWSSRSTRNRSRSPARTSAGVGETVSLDGRAELRRGRQDRRLGLGPGRRHPVRRYRQHAYGAPGTYLATLTVEDDAGVANAGVEHR